jgi:hypothetical protein
MENPAAGIRRTGLPLDGCTLGEVRRIIPPNREYPGTVFGLEYVWEQTEDQQQCLWVTQKWPLE